MQSVQSVDAPTCDKGVSTDYTDFTDGYLVGFENLKQALPVRFARAPQYVVRPPEVSNTEAVVNEHSSDAMKVTMAADSSTTPSRPIGIFERM